MRIFFLQNGKLDLLLYYIYVFFAIKLKYLDHIFLFTSTITPVVIKN